MIRLIKTFTNYFIFRSTGFNVNMKNSLHDSYFQDFISLNRFLYICGLFFILLGREVKRKFVLFPVGR